LAVLIQNQIMITAKYLPGSLNTIPDWESRNTRRNKVQRLILIAPAWQSQINSKQNLKISGLGDFRTRLPVLSQQADENHLFQFTRRPGISGLAGVVNNKLIHFVVV